MEDKNSTGSANSTEVAVSPPAQPPPPPSPDNKLPPPPSLSPRPPPPPPKTLSSPPPENSPTPSSQSPPPSSPPPPPSQSSPPQSPPPPNLISSPSPSNSNSKPPPSPNNPSDPHPEDSINIFPPPVGNNNNNNGNNGNGNNNNKQWDPPPPLLDSSSYSSQNSNGSPALSPTNESSNGPLPSNNNNGSPMLSIPLVTVVAAGAALLIIVMLILFFACRRKTNRERNDKMPHYNNRPTANNYYNSTATRPPQPRTNWQMDGGGGGAPLYNNTAHNQNHNIMHSNHDHELHALPPLPGGAGSKLDLPTPPPPHRSAAPVTSSDTSPASNSSPYGAVVPPPAPVLQALGQNGFTYEELSAATGGFSETNLLGKGGFGYVHKGTLPNGKEIAVKSLKSGSGSQGEREFKAEVDIISRVHHRHLVSLVGYCIAGDKRLLVYEYVPNNNLEYHLHGKGQPVLDWSARLKIALGSAKGLAYLHEDCHPRIIHRDIKSSNIVLDFTWEAKVGDFGLAKLNADNNTHVSTRVMGTFGYLAPEYASTGKLTEKSDVFSFGVMLLELITGRRPVDPARDMEDTLVDWARPLCLRALEDGNFDEIADPYLEKNYQVEEMARMVACAGASIRHSARRRPKVSQIVRALEGDVSLEDLNNGMKLSHASMFGGGITSSSRSYDLDNSSYTEDLKKLRKMAGENPDGRDVSSEYGATSEYGLNPSSSSSEFGSRDQSPCNNVKPSF